MLVLTVRGFFLVIALAISGVAKGGNCPLTSPSETNLICPNPMSFLFRGGRVVIEVPVPRATVGSKMTSLKLKLHSL